MFENPCLFDGMLQRGWMEPATEAIRWQEVVPKTLCEKLHHRSDWLVERFTLAQQLGIVMTKHQWDWDSHVPLLLIYFQSVDATSCFLALLILAGSSGLQLRRWYFNLLKFMVEKRFSYRCTLPKRHMVHLNILESSRKEGRQQFSQILSKLVCFSTHLPVLLSLRAELHCSSISSTRSILHTKGEGVSKNLKHSSVYFNACICECLAGWEMAVCFFKGEFCGECSDISSTDKLHLAL